MGHGGVLGRIWQGLIGERVVNEDERSLDGY